MSCLKKFSQEKKGLRMDSITLAAALGALECRWEMALALLAQCLQRLGSCYEDLKLKSP